MSAFNEYWFQTSGGGVDPETIPGSLRFRNEGSSANFRLRLTSTAQNSLPTPTNRSRWTMSVWTKDIKWRDTSAQGTIFGCHYRTSDSGYTAFNTGTATGGKPFIHVMSGGGTKSLTNVFEDGTGWTHHVWQCDADGAVKWHVNGVYVQTLSGYSTNWWFVPRPGNFQLMIGCGGNSSAQYWAGFRGNMAQFIFINGTGYAPDTFGQFDNSGVWGPKSFDTINDNVVWGTSGFALLFQDRNNLGKDSGPNGINFDAVDGFDTNPSSSNYDLSNDSPSRNYNIMYPGFRAINVPLVERGGLYMPSQAYWKGTIGTHAMLPGTGKYYFEAYTNDGYVGLADTTNGSALRYLDNPAVKTGFVALRANGNNDYIDTTTISGAPQWVNVWTGFVVDTDNNTIRYFNGSINHTLGYSSGTMANKPVAVVYACYGNPLLVNHGQQPFRLTQPAGTKLIASFDMAPPNLGSTVTGTFVGNGNADGPTVITNCLPGRIQYGSIDVSYQNRKSQTNVDFFANGFKVRSTSSNNNGTSYNFTVTTTHSGGEYQGKQVPFFGGTPAPAPIN